MEEFSYIDVKSFGNEIICWGRTKAGKLVKKIANTRDYSYCYIPANDNSREYEDINGTPMKRVSFDNRKEMLQYAKKTPNTCESEVLPAYKYLVDNFRETDPDFPFTLLYYDIEVDFDLEADGYPTPKNPHGEINMISCFDTIEDCYVIFIMDHLRGIVELEDKQDGYPVEIMWCRSERDMLVSFSSFLEPFDILTAWNGNQYDIPYIMERAFIHFGDDAKSLLCRDSIPARRRDFINEYHEEVWEWTLSGRIHLDMMLLFKKFHPAEKKSFALDNICEEELGEKKLDYVGDLGLLYRERPQRFAEYSLHDSRLLKMLNDKQQVIQLAMMMARTMCCLPPDVTGSVKIIETGFLKFCRNTGNVVIPDRKQKEKVSFPGALVYDTIPGHHKWIMTVDLTALYPSCMIMLGLSTENFILQCRKEQEDYIKVMTKSDETVIVDRAYHDESFEVTGRELEEIIRESGYTISANGSIFDGSAGLLSQYVDFIFQKRKGFKTQMKKADHPEDRNRFDLYQKVYKILANSLFGCIANKNFVLFDIRLARSITLTGQMVSKWQAYMANDLVNQLSEDK